VDVGRARSEELAPAGDRRDAGQVAVGQAARIDAEIRRLQGAGRRRDRPVGVGREERRLEARDPSDRARPRPPSPKLSAKHDYDLAITHEDRGDEMPRLAALFDPRPETLAAGGSNILGAVLPEPLRMELFRTRQFPRLVERAHNLHAHLYETMPLIPLRPVPTTLVGVSRRWQWTASGTGGPFADWSTWRELP